MTTFCKTQKQNVSLNKWRQDKKHMKEVFLGPASVHIYFYCIKKSILFVFNRNLCEMPKKWIYGLCKHIVALHSDDTASLP